MSIMTCIVLFGVIEKNYLDIFTFFILQKKNVIKNHFKVSQTVHSKYVVFIKVP